MNCNCSLKIRVERRQGLRRQQYAVYNETGAGLARGKEGLRPAMASPGFASRRGKRPRAGRISRGVVVFLCFPRVVYVVVVSAYAWACACKRAHVRVRRTCASVCFARAMGGVAVCGSAVS